MNVSPWTVQKQTPRGRRCPTLRRVWGSIGFPSAASVPSAHGYGLTFYDCIAASVSILLLPSIWAVCASEKVDSHP